MLKAAVIGVGSMGRNHARVYRESALAKLVGVADASKETAAKVGQMRGVPAYDNIEELLDKEKPEVVTIAVPTEAHLETAKLVIERGIHVLMEKPIASGG